MCKSYNFSLFVYLNDLFYCQVVHQLTWTVTALEFFPRLFRFCSIIKWWTDILLSTLFVPWVNLLEILLKFGCRFNIWEVKMERPGCCKLVLIQTDQFWTRVTSLKWRYQAVLAASFWKSMQHPHQQNHVFIWSMETPKEKKKRFLCKSPDSNNGEISEKNVFQHLSNRIYNIATKVLNFYYLFHVKPLLKKKFSG